MSKKESEASGPILEEHRITVIGPYWWRLFSICWSNADSSLFSLMFLTFSLHVVRFLPVWPMCTLWQLWQIILYM
jgi:hypothetical protein